MTDLSLIYDHCFDVNNPFSNKDGKALLNFCQSSYQKLDIIPAMKDFLPSIEIEEQFPFYITGGLGSPLQFHKGTRPEGIYGTDMICTVYRENDNGEKIHAAPFETTKVCKTLFVISSKEYHDACRGCINGVSMEWEIYIWLDLFLANCMNRFIDDGRSHIKELKSAFTFENTNRHFPMW